MHDVGAGQPEPLSGSWSLPDLDLGDTDHLMLLIGARLQLRGRMLSQAL